LLRLATCITHEHNPFLVVLAVCICAVACFAALDLRARRADGYAGNTWWLAGSALCFGCGVWATHFVAMLAFLAPVPVTYDIGHTAVSIVVSTLGVAAAFALADQDQRFGPVVGGLVIGLSIGAMHNIGMGGMELAGQVLRDPTRSTVSVGIGAAFAMLALFNERDDGSARRRALSVLLLVLAVGGLHFTAMSGTTIVPSVLASPSDAPNGNLPLAVAVAAVTGLILVLGAAASILDKRRDIEVDRQRALASVTFEGILIHRHGVVLDANEAFCRMVGGPVGGLRGKHLLAFIAPEDAEIVRAQIDRSTGQPFETTILTTDGRRCPVEILSREIERADGPARVMAIRDLTERHQAEEQVRHMAHHDVLTGLPNRALLAQRLSQALAAATPGRAQVGMLCIDLDRFKPVNDMLGHQSGDLLLTQVAQRLRACARTGDTVARLGGDEFAIALPAVAGMDVAQAIARRVVATLSQPFDVNGAQVSIGASVGVALSTAEGTSPERLLRDADTALYVAKESGRGRECVFDAAMGQRVSDRRQLEQDLREAVAGQQLELFYQPVVDCRTEAVLGYEALVRWNHPTRGRVPPIDFIPLAEETGTIIELGRWVMETACAQAASWPLPRRIAVNLSPAQFQQPDLVEMVVEILQRTGLPPARLEIEVTEGVLIADADAALRIFRGLRAAGVKIALDDFGSGYSSMTYLRQFPFDKIKIDRAFIHGLETDQEAQAIVGAILALASGLHMQVTAEGVETESQLEELRARGCGQVQGYLLGLPVPAANLDFSPPRAVDAAPAPARALAANAAD